MNVWCHKIDDRWVTPMKWSAARREAMLRRAQGDKTAHHVRRAQGEWVVARVNSDGLTAYLGRRK